MAYRRGARRHTAKNGEEVERTQPGEHLNCLDSYVSVRIIEERRILCLSRTNPPVQAETAGRPVLLVARRIRGSNSEYSIVARQHGHTRKQPQ